MAAARQRASPPARNPARVGARPAWPAVADAFGHSVLIFVFLPTLVALPEFVGYELRNPFNYADPVVLALLPARAVRALLNAFAAGVIPGSLAGAINAALLCAWVWARPSPATPAGRIALGGLVGLVAGLLAVLAVVAIQFGREGVTNAPLVAIAFETASAGVCGMVVAPTAMRMLVGAGPAAGTSLRH